MSFLRHKQIYRPMLLTSKRDSFATVPLSSSDESATGYSSASCTPAALACASPAFAIVKPIAGNRQPPLIQGWGIFTRRNGDFSAGVDSNIEAAGASTECCVGVMRLGQSYSGFVGLRVP